MPGSTMHNLRDLVPNSPSMGCFNSSVGSLQGVATILEYFHHPFLLVGDAAAFWMGVPWFDHDIVDILIRRNQLRDITLCLINTGDWVVYPNEPTLQRGCSYFLERRSSPKRTCQYLRLWSEEAYCMLVDRTPLIEIPPEHYGEGFGIGSCWTAHRTSSLTAPSTIYPSFNFRCIIDGLGEDQPCNIASNIYLPTLPAFINTLILQRLVLAPSRMQYGDAHGQIRRLIEMLQLERPAAKEVLLSQSPYAEVRLSLLEALEGYTRNPCRDNAKSRWIAELATSAADRALELKQKQDLSGTSVCGNQNERLFRTEERSAKGRKREQKREAQTPISEDEAILDCIVVLGG